MAGNDYRSGGVSLSSGEHGFEFGIGDDRGSEGDVPGEHTAGDCGGAVRD